MMREGHIRTPPWPGGAAWSRRCPRSWAGGTATRRRRALAPWA